MTYITPFHFHTAVPPPPSVHHVTVLYSYRFPHRLRRRLHRLRRLLFPNLRPESPRLLSHEHQKLLSFLRSEFDAGAGRLSLRSFSSRKRFFFCIFFRRRCRLQRVTSGRVVPGTPSGRPSHSASPRRPLSLGEGTIERRRTRLRSQSRPHSPRRLFRLL